MYRNTFYSVLQGELSYSIVDAYFTSCCLTMIHIGQKKGKGNNDGVKPPRWMSHFTSLGVANMKCNFYKYIENYLQKCAVLHIGRKYSQIILYLL